MIAAASAAVAVECNHVETSRHCRRPGDPVHPDHPAQQRWQLQGVKQPMLAAVFRLVALARLARAHVLGNVRVHVLTNCNSTGMSCALLAEGPGVTSRLNPWFKK